MMSGVPLETCSDFNKLWNNKFYYKMHGAWGDVVVKALRYGIDPQSLGIFSGASDSSMCPGVDSASKNEYQDIPWGKHDRCVRVTTLPPSCAGCLEILEP
jgi:hypothetical protein